MYHDKMRHVRIKVPGPCILSHNIWLKNNNKGKGKREFKEIVHLVGNLSSQTIQLKDHRGKERRLLNIRIPV